MGNTPYEVEQRRKAHVERERQDQRRAYALAERIIAEVNSVVIRPGPKPEERECTAVAAELRALQPRIAAIILEE